jgi:hypothetical protein
VFVAAPRASYPVSAPSLSMVPIPTLTSVAADGRPHVRSRTETLLLDVDECWRVLGEGEDDGCRLLQNAVDPFLQSLCHRRSCLRCDVVDGDIRWDPRDDDLVAWFIGGLDVGNWRAWSLRLGLLVRDDRCLIIRFLALKRTDCFRHCCRGCWNWAL